MKVAEQSIVYIMDSAVEAIPMWYKCYFGNEEFIIAILKLVKVQLHHTYFILFSHLF